MHIAVLTLEFHLEGCSSLKEKRQRLAGLRDKFGKQVNVAVCESDFHDKLQRAEWSFVITGSDKNVITQIISSIEDHASSRLDARIVDRHVQYL